MRIIIANDTYYPNIDGCSYFSQRLAHYLKERGHSILVIAPAKTWHTGFFSHDGIDIFGIYSMSTLFVHSTRFSPAFFVKNKIKKVIQDFKPDVIHVQGHFFVERAVVEVAKQLHIPLIGTNHFMPDNLTPYVPLPKKVEEWIKSLLWKDFTKVFNKLDFVTTPTLTAANILKKIGFTKPVTPISCGIDTQKFNSKNDGDYLRKRYHLPSEPILLSVCRLAPEKNVDAIIRAFALAHAKTPIHLLVAGDGAERKKLEKLTRDLHIENSVTFTGHVSDDDLVNMYPLASVFVTAGTAELQSLVTMEAMASGLPVIAVNAKALPELVHHGENGYLFEHDDIQSMADSIVRIFSDNALRDAMAKKSLEIAKTHDIHHTIDQFEKLYRLIQNG